MPVNSCQLSAENHKSGPHCLPRYDGDLHSCVSSTAASISGLGGTVFRLLRGRRIVKDIDMIPGRFCLPLSTSPRTSTSPYRRPATSLRWSSVSSVSRPYSGGRFLSASDDDPSSSLPSFSAWSGTSAARTVTRTPRWDSAAPSRPSLFAPPPPSARASSSRPSSRTSEPDIWASGPSWSRLASQSRPSSSASSPCESATDGSTISSPL